ncbi:hypothetical protein [Polyangium spumosum]|uniref:Lipoprotein n=1 Tax=Polyangium spumosum TaxID=889282 RepID=A0A6N7PVE8_9BACT|nr:hypothetical protein [Polyangium spumosum]MRG94054.1 hypothetical protein [Polyangium spumosum]
MNPLRAFLVVLASSTALLAGCVLSDAENPFGEGDLDVPLETAGIGGEVPPCGTNGFSPPCFWAAGSQTGLRDLAKAKLATTATGLLPLAPTIAAGCREVIRNAVECALSPRQSVRDPVTGETYTGHWSLATGWYSNPLDLNGQKWVTACMVQRLNVLGEHVDVLLEGAHSRITENATYDPLYPFEESSVFGNLFNSTIPPTESMPAFHAYICSEDDLNGQCPIGPTPWLDHRICDDVPSACGLIYIGSCSSTCIKNGAYWSCPVPGGFVYNPETVRVQLEDPTACY